MEKWFTDEEFAIFNNQLIEEADIGSVIVFGEYEQDGDTSNGKEFIEWVYADDELFENFDYENVDYDELVDEFENSTDEYTADKDLWDEIVRRYCDDYIKERCAE